MPRFYFDVHDGIHVVDEDGRDLHDRDAAKLDAMNVAVDFVARPNMLGQTGGALTVNVRDTPDHVLFRVRLVFNIEEK